MGALVAADPLWRVASTYAQSSGGTGNLLVLCQLAGGLDALSFLAPYQNSVYQSRRPQLALPAEEVTPLPDANNYGINNQFSFFSDLYAEGNLAIVQQVGYPDSNGSHFESQDWIESGIPGDSLDGWLNRHVSTLPLVSMTLMINFLSIE